MILEHIFAGLFGAGVSLRNQMYDSGRLRVNELRGPVVSIGNISVGGSGKTPFTIYLGTLLKQRGIAFDILSRGYRRRTTGNRIVDPNGSARDFGDEPLLMARELDCDVIVGEDRYQAGLLAERTWGSRLHLLDDAFQHRRLARQFDIVLLSPEDLDDVLLPAGRLREPLSSLSRADAVVITGDTATAKLPPHLPAWNLTRTLEIMLGAPSFPSFGKGRSADNERLDGAPYLPSSGRCGNDESKDDLQGAPSFPFFGKGRSADNERLDGAPHLPSSGRCGITNSAAQRRNSLAHHVSGGNPTEVTSKSALADGTLIHPVVFCGIAKPQNFFAQVRALGITPAAEVTFRDHHRYSAADIRRLERIAQLRHADGFLTTAKDAINLEGLVTMWHRHSCLCIAKLTLSLDKAESLMETLLSTLAQRGKPA